MFHPLATASNPEDNTADEYIELFNPGTAPVKLWTLNGVWRLDGGVQFLFPGQHDSPSGTALLLV